MEDLLGVADYFIDYFTTIADETLKLNPPRSVSTAVDKNDHIEHFTELKELSIITDHEMRKIIYLSLSTDFDMLNLFLEYCTLVTGHPVFTKTQIYNYKQFKLCIFSLFTKQYAPQKCSFVLITV